MFYQFTATNSGNHTITFTKSIPSDDIDVKVYQGCSSTTEVASIGANGITETTTFNCTAGTNYRIRAVSSNSNGSGGFSIKVTCPSLSYTEQDYLPYREGKHFIFDIPTSYLIENITPENFGRWMQHMDAVYEAYSNLMGGHTPCDGQKLTFVASDDGYGWLWVYPDNPFIY